MLPVLSEEDGTSRPLDANRDIAVDARDEPDQLLERKAVEPPMAQVRDAPLMSAEKAGSMRLTPAANPRDDELRQLALEHGDWIVPLHTVQYCANAARRPYRDLSARSTALQDRRQAHKARAGAGSEGAAMAMLPSGRDA